jgi:hypothetical protein
MSQAKRQVYPLVGQQLAVLTRQMGTSQPGAIHRQLCALACDLFQLAGEISEWAYGQSTACTSRDPESPVQTAGSGCQVDACSDLGG